MAWHHNIKGGRSWFGKAEAKANGKRARRQDDREAINSDTYWEGYVDGYLERVDDERALNGREAQP